MSVMMPSLLQRRRASVDALLCRDDAGQIFRDPLAPSKTPSTKRYAH